MIHCPRCQVLIEEDYGVITCPQCAAVMMVDLDGRVLLTEDAEAPNLESGADEPAADEPEGVYEAQPAPEAESTFESEPEPAPEYFQMPTDEEFQDLGVEEFAKSEISSVKEGLYLYEISIEELDTQEIIADVRKVLEDPRFELDTEHMFQELVTSNGILIVRDLGPVKASMLLARLHSFPIVISWEQYLVHGEETKK